LCWVLGDVGRRCKLALRGHRLWLGLIRRGRAVGMILWLVLLESGCIEIWEAGVCVGGVSDEGVVRQRGRWVGIAILVGVHGRRQEARTLAMAAQLTADTPD
jgi:hypothetical protein